MPWVSPPETASCAHGCMYYDPKQLLFPVCDDCGVEAAKYNEAIHGKIEIPEGFTWTKMTFTNPFAEDEK